MITKSAELLTDPVTRRHYDSIDPKNDDSLPKVFPSLKAIFPNQPYFREKQKCSKKIFTQFSPNTLKETAAGVIKCQKFRNWVMQMQLEKKLKHFMNTGMNSKVGEIIIGKTRKILNQLKIDMKNEKLKNSIDLQGKTDFHDRQYCYLALGRSQLVQKSMVINSIVPVLASLGDRKEITIFRQKKKKVEMARIRKLVDMAYDNDPR